MQAIVDAYLAKIISYHQSIPVQGIIPRQAEITLDSIYIPLSLRLQRDKINAKPLDNRARLRLFERDRDTSFEYFQDLALAEETVLTLEQLWERNHHWLLVGPTGAGKTTLLYYAAYQAAKQPQGRLPLSINLRFFAHEWEKHPQWQVDNALFHYLTGPGLKELGFLDVANWSTLKDYFEEVLTIGQALLLLDDLELNRSLAITESLEKLLQRFPDNRCLVTTRFTGQQDHLLRGHFQIAHLEAFSETQIHQCLSQWSYTIEIQEDIIADAHTLNRARQKTAALLEHFERQPTLYQLAENPLLCVLMSSLHHQGLSLPTQRVQYYKVILDNFIYQWEHYKRKQGLIKDQFTAEQTQEILEIIALYFQEHCSDHRATIPSIIKVVCDYLQAEKGYSTEQAEYQTRQFIKLMRRQPGLFLEQGNEKYSFFHLIVQEYLTARALIRHPHHRQRYWQHYLFQPHWREIGRLAAAYQGQTTPEAGSEWLTMLLAAPDSAHEQIMYYKFRLAFFWLRETPVTLDMADELFHTWIRLFIQQPHLWGLLLSLLADGGFKPLYYPQTLAPLLAALQSADDDWVRSALIQALGYLQDAAVIAPLLKVLQHDKGLLVRGAAAQALESLSNIPATTALIEASQPEQEEAVRVVAIHTLGHLQDPTTLSLLEEYLIEEQEAIRESVVVALGEFKTPAACEQLVHIVQHDSHQQVRKAAVLALSHYRGARVSEILLQVLQQDESEAVTRAAAEALGQFANTAQSLLEILTHTEAETVRKAAAQALSLLNAPETLSPLLELVHHSNADHVRGAAVYALGSFHQLPTLTPLLQALEQDNNDWVRGVAAHALGNLKDPNTIDALIHTLQNDSNDWVRGMTAYALGNFKQPRVVTVLLETLDQVTDPWVRGGAVYALGHLRATSALTALIEIVQQEPNERVRCIAAHALGNLQNAAVVMPLLQAIQTDQEDSVRRSATHALEHFKDPAAVDRLLTALTQSKDERMRRTIVQVLANLRAPQSLKILIERVRSDKNDAVRWSAAQALGYLHDPAALPALVERLEKDKNDTVRGAAAQALELIELGIPLCPH